ncbi:MmgE/PrpD family protein [Arthrobacter sp. H5]|uniref:MmgE/PrpD family protein n=1 Tax=Arthrobacter sp. H5 TaxID=1267973 RepID=UPI0004AE7EBD|nr:MmgE/PrpD family protein [Arthrobacter sp. H5]
MRHSYDDVTEFIHGVSHRDIPADVLHQARRCLIDLVGVAAAGTPTRLSEIVRNHAYRQAGESAQASRLLFDGRRVGAAQAALANAGTIDSMDGHDGHRLVKGHAGVTVLPAALAFMDESDKWTIDDLLTTLIVGYEVSLRAGIALHRTAADYHSSGSWNAIGAAAAGARTLGLGPEETWHALGIAEYSAPRGPMMRAISHPTMVKDSSAWGAQAGVAAAYLAVDGFTGAPAELLTVGRETSDLGERWRIMEQYFKPYPVCRWAHPAIQAGLSLMARHRISADQIDDVEVNTFDAAARLHTAAPTSTEQAQYSLPFTLAAALVHGTLGPENILDPAAEADSLSLAQRIRLLSSPRMTERFPAVRLADVSITLKDGRSFTSGDTLADGDPESPLSDETLLEKFRHNTQALGPERSSGIVDIIWSSQKNTLRDLMTLVMPPLPSSRS